MAKSLIRQRREAGAICSHCQSPDYRLDLSDEDALKPGFRCGSCGSSWRYGYGGGKYAKLLTGPEKTKLEKWIYGMNDPDLVKKWENGILSNWDPIAKKWVEARA